jgi:hypothetical protein
VREKANKVRELRMLIKRRDAAIPQYARTSCLGLAARVAKLPQELRDMIYDSVLDPDVRQNIEIRLRNERCRFIPTKLAPLPHILDAQFVRSDIPSDLTHCYAKPGRKTPWLINLISVRSVDWLEVRWLGLPLNAFIREMKIEVSFWQFLSIFDQIRGCDVFSEPCWPRYRKDLLNSLVSKVKLVLEALGSGGCVRFIEIAFSRTNVRAAGFATARYDSFVDDLFKELGVGGWGCELRGRANV